MSKKTYICRAYVGVIVEAEDEFDIDWEAEESASGRDYLTALQNHATESKQ
mgnify:CR=1 FL=1